MGRVVRLACRLRRPGPSRGGLRRNRFAFQGPDTLPAGRTIFHFRNAGTVNHELGLSLLRPGVTGAQALAAELAGADVDSIYESDGLLFAQSGDQVDMGLVIDLEPGRHYVLICTLDAGPRHTPHVRLGMFKNLEVRGGVP